MIRAGIDRQRVGGNNPGFGRPRDVLAEGGDDAARDDGGAGFNPRPRRGHDARVADGEITGLAALRRSGTRRSRQQKETNRATGEHRIAEDTPISHAQLLAMTNSKSRTTDLFCPAQATHEPSRKLPTSKG